MKRVLCVGHAVQDYVFTVPQLPRVAEKYRASSFDIVGGGPAATAAVAIARLEGAARLAARLGDDSIATAIEAELAAYGVDCTGVRRFPGRHSSLSAVFVDTAGERMVVNYTDPEMPAEPGWIDDLTLDDVDAVLADTRWPEGARRVLERARARRLPAVLDVDVPMPSSTELLGAATHVAFSAPGLRELAPHHEPELALRVVALRLRCWCAVTLGAEGVLFADGRAVATSAQLRLERLPAFAVRAVDTLGAGDVWHGAFTLALAEGAEEPAAVRAASAAAALKVTRPGGRAGVPTRLERDRLLENA